MSETSPIPGEPEPGGLPLAVSQPRRKFQDRVWLHWTLFVLAALSTTYVGAFHYVAYLSDFGQRAIRVSSTYFVLHGLWYSGTILLILGAHEMGHYIACRYYQVDASRPYFIPFPWALTGTLGAVIRIREPIPSKRMLFDIGIAGPLAGFLFIIPTLFVGMSWSPVIRVPPAMVGLELGEPLLFKIAAWVTWGTIREGYSTNLHPMAFGAWFGLLATSLNLFPIGQLDGGHISYAVLGRRSTAVTIGSLLIAIGLTFFSVSWMMWTVLLILAMYVMGPRHPRTIDEHIPLDRTRIYLALLAAVVFVLCFTPTPIEPLDLLKTR